MGCITRDDLLKPLVGVKTQKVDLDADSFVIVRELDTKDLVTLEKHEGNNVEAMLLICLTCMVDESGNTLLNPDDLEMLRQKPVAMIKKIATSALELSGVVDEKN